MTHSIGLALPRKVRLTLIPAYALFIVLLPLATLSLILMIKLKGYIVYYKDVDSIVQEVKVRGGNPCKP